MNNPQKHSEECSTSKIFTLRHKIKYSVSPMYFYLIYMFYLTHLIPVKQTDFPQQSRGKGIMLFVSDNTHPYRLKVLLSWLKSSIIFLPTFITSRFKCAGRLVAFIRSNRDISCVFQFQSVLNCIQGPNIFAPMHDGIMLDRNVCSQVLSVVC